MVTGTAAAATHSWIHRTMFISLILPPKHYTNFVLCCTPVNNLKHQYHYVGSQTALDPTVSSTILLTILLRQCVPPPCDHSGNTHVQNYNAFQRASTSYEILNFSRVSLRLHCPHITLVPHYIFHRVLQADILAKQLFVLLTVCDKFWFSCWQSHLPLKLAWTCNCAATFHSLHAARWPSCSDVTCKVGVAARFQYSLKFPALYSKLYLLVPRKYLRIRLT
jgi:hypothetical protein